MKFFKSASKNGNDSGIKSIDTVIGQHTIFNGTLQAENSVCVEGEFRGHLTSKGGVLINRNGVIEADIVAEYIVVHGKVIGNINAQRQLEISDTGKVRGDVQAPSVVIVKGGILDGFCRMVKPPEQQPQSHQSEPDQNDSLLDDIIVPLEDGVLGTDDEDEHIHILRSFEEPEDRAESEDEEDETSSPAQPSENPVHGTEN